MQFILDTYTDIRDLGQSSYYRDFVRQGFYQRFVATNYGMLCYGDSPRGALDVLNGELDIQCLRFRKTNDIEGMRDRLLINGETWTEVDDGSHITLVAQVNPRGQALLNKDSHEPLPVWVDPIDVRGSRAWFINEVKALFEAYHAGAYTRAEVRSQHAVLKAIHDAYVADNG